MDHLSFQYRLGVFLQQRACDTTPNVVRAVGDIRRILRQAVRPGSGFTPWGATHHPRNDQDKCHLRDAPSRPLRCTGKGRSHPGGGARGLLEAPGAINVTTLPWAWDRGCGGWRLGRRWKTPGKPNSHPVPPSTKPPGPRSGSRRSPTGVGLEGGVAAKNLVSSCFSPKFSPPEKMLMKDQLCDRSVFFGLLPRELDKKPRSKVTSPILWQYGNTFCSLLTPPGGMGTASGGPGGS